MKEGLCLRLVPFTTTNTKGNRNTEIVADWCLLLIAAFLLDYVASKAQRDSAIDFGDFIELSLVPIEGVCSDSRRFLARN